MRCFYRECCGQVDLVTPVLLMCDCLIGICQECAKRELLITFSSERHKKKVIPDNELNDSKYEAYLCCPQCQGKVSSIRHNIIKGVENALEAEEKLLLAAMTDARMSYYKHSTDLVELERCWTILNDESDKSIKTEPGVLPNILSSNSETEMVRVARLRKKIAAFALEQYSHYANPLDALSFTTNNILGRIRQQPLQNTSVGTSLSREGVSSATECIVCTNPLQPGFSVQLTCVCNHILCRSCALINIHYRPETYHKGVCCPQCRAYSPGVLQNTHTVREIEDLFVQSGRHYFTNRLLAFRDKGIVENERTNYIQMIKMYHAIGYEGNLNILNEKERDSATVARLKLEVAKLEECRLNRLGILDTYSLRCEMNPATTSLSTSINTSSSSNENPHNDNSNAGKFPISFLHALKVRKNNFFEHFYLRNASTAHSNNNNEPAVLSDCHTKYAVLLPQMRDLVANEANRLDLLDKIVLVCVKIHQNTTAEHDSTHNNTTAPTIATTPTDSANVTISQMVTMVHNYLKHPELPYHKYFLSANNRNEFMSLVYKKVNAQSVQQCVKKLVLHGLVSLVTSELKLYEEECYVLTDTPLSKADLDPLLTNSLDTRYYTNYNLLTSCSNSGTTPTTGTSATTTTSLSPTTNSVLPRFVNAINNEDADSVSPTVYKVYSVRATLIDPNRPNRPNKKRKSDTSGSSSSSNNHAAVDIDESTSSNTSSSNVAVTSSSTVSPPVRTTMPVTSSATTASAYSTTTAVAATATTSGPGTGSVQRKRGRPSKLDQAIALSLAESTTGSHGYDNNDAPMDMSSETHHPSNSGNSKKTTTSNDAIRATPTAISATNSNSTKRATQPSNPQNRKYIVVRDPVTGKQHRKFLDSFDDSPSTASSSMNGFSGGGGGGKGQADMSDDEDEVIVQRKRKVQKNEVTSASNSSSTSISHTKANDGNKKVRSSLPSAVPNDEEMDGGNGSDGGDNNSDFDPADAENQDDEHNSNKDSDNDSGSESDASSMDTTGSGNNEEEEQLQNMIKSLKHAATEAFKDAARVREENKLLRTELASVRNANDFTLPAQKIEMDALKARATQLKEQLKAEEAKRIVLEKEKEIAVQTAAAADAARQAERQKLDAKIASLQQQNKTINEECEQYKASLRTTDAELKTIRADIEKFTAQVDKLKNANIRFKKEKEDVEKSLDTARQAHLNVLNAKDKAIKQLQEDLTKKKETNQGDAAHSENLYRNYHCVVQKIADKKAEMEVLQKQHDDLAIRNANYELELKNLKRELNEVKDQNGQQQDEIKELTQEVADLRKMKHKRESEEKQAMEDLFTIVANDSREI